MHDIFSGNGWSSDKPNTKPDLYPILKEKKTKDNPHYIPHE